MKKVAHNVTVGSINDDPLLADSNNQLVGVEEDDSLLLTVTQGGENVFTLNLEEDIFIADNDEISNAVDTINNFIADNDIAGVEDLNLNFGNLTVEQTAADTSINNEGQEISVLIELEAGLITDEL